MTDNEKINGWTFEETIKTAENLMETESNMFKWDVLRHLRDFVENFKDELEQYRAIGTIEEFKALKEKETEILLKDGQLLYQQGLVDGYNKAIDEFVSRLEKHEQENWIDHQEYGITWADIEQIAEQMKGGGNSED